MHNKDPPSSGWQYRVPLAHRVSGQSNQEVAMNPVGKKVLELFASWSFARFETENPGADASVEEREEFDAKVKDALTEEYRKAQRMVREVSEDSEGKELQVTVKAGLAELQSFRTHPAFARTEACGSCSKSARLRGARALKWCPCPSSMQLFIDKALGTFRTKDDRRMLMLTLLQLRETVDHYNFYGNGKPRLKELVADRREREPMREATTIVREDWKDDNVLRYSETVDVATTDTTSRLNADLQSWDRPSAPSKRTQRLAFCGACADQGNNPWFWVARKRVNGEYERGPFALTAHCPVCKALEVTPTLPPRTNVQWVVRKVRRHGAVTVEYHLFYRSRGRWVNGTTHEVCSTDLDNRLQLRWKQVKPLRVKA